MFTSRLVVAGWALVLAAAVLVPIAKGAEDAPTGIVLGVIAIAMGAWVWFRDSRAALITSLVLGVLLVLAFGAFVLADLAEDGTEALITLGDAVAVIGGAFLIAGAIGALRESQTPANAEPTP